MKRKARLTPRRFKGTGSRFWSESRQRYVARVLVGHYPGGGPKYKTCTARTAGELQRVVDGIDTHKLPDKTTLASWLERWLAGLTCKPGTKRSRTAAVTHHIAPSLGHIRVTELTAHQIEVAAGKWNLEPTSARNVVSILGTALRAAVRAGLRTDNPAHAAHKPKTPRKKIDPFTAEEVVAISREAAKRPNTRAVALLAATGMRVGEALALDCSDFDRLAGSITITKTLDTADPTVLGTPKSENSLRTIRVPARPPEGIAALAAACGTRTSGPVFRTGSGKRTVYRVIASAWRVLLKRLGIRYRGTHQLRHAWASHALSAGVDVAEVAAYLGNTVAEVHKTYAHPTRRTDPAAAMERFFGHQGDNKVTGNSPHTIAPKQTKAKRRK